MTNQWDQQELADGGGPATEPVRPAPRRRIAGISTVAAAALIAAGLVGLGVVATQAADDTTVGGAPMALAGDASGGTWGWDGGPGDGPGGHHRGDHLGGPRGGGHLADAATAIGITTDELVTELRAGKSIADVAAAKGVAVATVTAAIVAAEKQEIADAVAAGRFTQARADQILAEVDARVSAMVNGTFPGRPDGSAGMGFGMGGHHGRGDRGPGGFAGDGRADELAVVADALGLTTDELRTKLQAGSSIADVATAEKVAVDTVIDALVAHEKQEIADAVAAGRLTQAQADQIGATLVTRVTDQVNRVFRGGPHGDGDCPNPDGSAGTSSGSGSGSGTGTSFSG